MKNLKKVPGFSGYFVSPEGKVYSKKRGNELVELSPSTTTGYAHVKFSNGPEKQNFQVHRLVASLFIPNRKKLEIVNHIDGDKLNNNVKNLEWVDRKGNARHHVEKLLPKQRAERKSKKENELKIKMSIISHAHSVCADNTELFYSLYKTAMEN